MSRAWWGSAAGRMDRKPTRFGKAQRVFGGLDPPYVAGSAGTTRSLARLRLGRLRWRHRSHTRLPGGPRIAEPLDRGRIRRLTGAVQTQRLARGNPRRRRAWLRGGQTRGDPARWCRDRWRIDQGQHRGLRRRGGGFVIAGLPHCVTRRGQRRPVPNEAALARHRARHRRHGQSADWA